jgi:renalase
MKKPKVAIIGAGITGASCAYHLSAHGFNPSVFEKSRGVGGRLATRNIDNQFFFDHGAQYYTIRNSEFALLTETAGENNACAEWFPRPAENIGPYNKSMFVGTPKMNSFLKPLFADSQLIFKEEITRINMVENSWNLISSDGLADKFDIVVSTIPAPQAKILFKDILVDVQLLDKVAMLPCWALMIAFETPLNFEFDIWRSENSDISWLSRNSSKPQRVQSQDSWVCHANPKWSSENIDKSREEVCQAMIGMLADIYGCKLPKTLFEIAHRWRYAQAANILGQPYLTNNNKTLYVAGDWCLGSRVEAGFESGSSVAQSIISNL